MILADSSVWIDYFKGTLTPQTGKLDRLLGRELLAIGDLILTEVLQGFAGERDFNQARKMLTSLVVVELGGQGIALPAAKNFRSLRKLGVTVRKTVSFRQRCVAEAMREFSSDEPILMMSISVPNRCRSVFRGDVISIPPITIQN